jgi:streptogramin lyase
MKLFRPLINHVKDSKARWQRSRPKSRRAQPALEYLEARRVLSTITELASLPTLNSAPAGITAASDGSIWFTESSANQLGRLSPQGTLTEYPVPTAASDPEQITASPDGYVWFTERYGGKIGRVSAAGGPIAEFALIDDHENPTAITTRSDGSVWFASYGFDSFNLSPAGRLGEISSMGTITELVNKDPGLLITGLVGGPDGNLWVTQWNYNWDGLDDIGEVNTAAWNGWGSFGHYSLSPTYNNVGPQIIFPSQLGTYTDPYHYVNAGPQGITVGPDNNLWFTEFGTGKIGRITTSGFLTEFALPAGSEPQQIVTGPDNAVWFTEAGTNKIGRMDMQGRLTELAIPTAASLLYGITRGLDGQLWFTEQSGNKLGSIWAGLSLPGRVPAVSSSPVGYTPAQIRHAYGFDQITLGNGAPGDGSG